MASRPKGYGMTAELADKKAAKYSPQLDEEVREWLKAVTGEPFPGGTEVSSDSFHEALKDGVYLCKAMNVIQPGSIKAINTSKMAFKQMENIGKFLDACYGYGVQKNDTFQTVDLYEGQNIPQVINGIQALGRQAQKRGFSGPSLGPAEATENKREFTEEQLQAGKGIIGLQMGSNKGATQSGQNFGKSRSILD